MVSSSGRPPNRSPRCDSSSFLPVSLNVLLHVVIIDQPIVDIPNVSDDKRLLYVCPQILPPPVPTLIFILMATEQVSPRCSIYTLVAEFAIGFIGDMDILALG